MQVTPPRALLAWGWLALLACASPLVEQPLSLPLASPASAEGAPLLAPSSEPAPTATATAAVSAPLAVAYAPPAPPAPSVPARLTLEPAHHAAAPSLAPAGAARQEQLRELERWNQGGLGDGIPWHPVPRVVIEEPVLSKGKGDTKKLMKHLRAEHYWTARKCFDAQLREHPDLSGRVVLRATQNSRGVITQASARGATGVPDKRKHKTALKSATVGSCIASSLRGAALPLARKGGATFSFSVDLYPGDAPLPEPDNQTSPGRADLPAINLALARLAPALGACFEEASARKPGLWGRLAIRGELTEEGRLRSTGEVESTFPDTEATKCAQKRIEEANFPPPLEGTPLLVVPLRWAPPG